MKTRRFYEAEFEQRAARDNQLNEKRRHHFTPTQECVVHLDRYQKAYAEKGKIYIPLHFFHRDNQKPRNR